MSDKNQQNSLNSLKTTFHNGKIADQSDFASLIDYFGNVTVTDNSDGTISINGIRRSVYGPISSGTDLFGINSAGVWTYDSSTISGLVNFPSSASKAVIVATGSNDISNGMQLSVFDNAGNTYFTAFNGSGYNAWQQPATKTDVQNALGATNGVDPAVQKVSQHITSNDDLNTFHNSGTYWLNYTVPQNAPSELAGTFPHGKLVISNDAVYGDSTTTVQILYLADGAGTDGVPPIYIRHDDNNHTAWSVWHSIPDTAEVVKDNQDGTITFNGITLPLAKKIDPNADLFTIKTAGTYISQWGNQNTLKNYPSGDGASTIIYSGVDTTEHGIKITVLDSWGGEFVSYWNNDHYTPWQSVVTVSNLNSVASSAASSAASYASSVVANFSGNGNGSGMNTDSVNSLVNSMGSSVANYASSVASNAVVNMGGNDIYEADSLTSSLGNSLTSYASSIVANLAQEVAANSTGTVYTTNSLANSATSYASSAVSSLSNWIGSNTVADNNDGTISFNNHHKYSLLQEISGVTDYNTLTTSGFYVIDVGNNKDCPNGPLASIGNSNYSVTSILQVFNDGQGDIFQTSYIPEQTYPWIRQYSFGNWTNWQPASSGGSGGTDSTALSSASTALSSASTALSSASTALSSASTAIGSITATNVQLASILGSLVSNSASSANAAAALIGGSTTNNSANSANSLLNSIIANNGGINPIH